MSDLVSVIVPCFDQAKYLPMALDSLLRQTHECWECIIVNDGSPDNTRQLAEIWTTKDRRFRYFEKTNGGLSSARNAGLALAKGHWIQFLDADDVILPNKFELQSRQLSKSPPYSLSFCDYIRGSEENIYVPPSPLANYLPPLLSDVTSVYELAADWETRLSIPAHCFLFNRVFFDEGIAFDESLANHEDWDCWMRIFNRTAEVDYCPEKLAIYRDHPNSMCRDLEKMKVGFLQAISKQLADQSLPRELKAVLRVKYSEIKFIYELQLQNNKNKKNSFLAKMLSLINKYTTRQ